MISSEEAVFLLKSEGCSPEVVKHSLAVSKIALRIGKKLRACGYAPDLEFIKVAAILHDIGRSKTHGIKHGIEGGKILRKLNFSNKFIRVCESHLGGGIAKEEAKSLGLLPRDYFPRSLEEKIIAHADNLISGDQEVPLKKTLTKLKQKLGENHPAVSRVKSLSDEIEALISRSSPK